MLEVYLRGGCIERLIIQTQYGLVFPVYHQPWVIHGEKSETMKFIN